MLGCAARREPTSKLFRDGAKEIKAILDAEGVGDMPVWIDVASRDAVSSSKSSESRSATGSR